MATQTAPRRLSPRGLALLKSFERGPAVDFAPEPYDDGGGVMTIGWGHRIFRGESFAEPIGRAQADRILLQDLRNPEVYVSALTLPSPLEQCEFDALVLFTFNLGVGALDRSTLLKVLRRPVQDADAIARQWMRWVYRGDPPERLDGLVIRRSCELMLFQGADDVAIDSERRRLQAQAREGSL